VFSVLGGRSVGTARHGQTLEVKVKHHKSIIVSKMFLESCSRHNYAEMREVDSRVAIRRLEKLLDAKHSNAPSYINDVACSPQRGRRAIYRGHPARIWHGTLLATAYQHFPQAPALTMRTMRNALRLLRHLNIQHAASVAVGVDSDEAVASNFPSGGT